MSTEYNNLFSSLISDIKSYTGSDPLLPWLRGIRKMKDTLPRQLLEEKLPRFLQKCSETFISDRRYSNDLRYLRVWLQLMDYVDDPKAILKIMEGNQIGEKKSLFYQAYSLYYEKMKKYDAADKIYHKGLQNLAEPAEELQKSYEQFLSRMERHKTKIRKLREGKKSSSLLAHNGPKGCKENSQISECKPNNSCSKENLLETQGDFVTNGNSDVSSESSQNGMSMMQVMPSHVTENLSNVQSVDDQLPRKLDLVDSGAKVMVEQQMDRKLSRDDSLVVKFVDTAIVGKLESEDARHHGLVEPTINTKEAMKTINSMFQEPLEQSISNRASRGQMNSSSNLDGGFNVYDEENTKIQFDKPSKCRSMPQCEAYDVNQHADEAFKIYCDSEDHHTDVEENVKYKNMQTHESRKSSVNHGFEAAIKPVLIPLKCSEDQISKFHHDGLKEETVVSRFVGSTISDEPEVENVWHHGLVEPTVNMKEAMNDINIMFGKPIEYTRKRRSKKQENSIGSESNHFGGFLILPDDVPSDRNAEDDIGCTVQKPINFLTKCSPDNQDNAPGAMNNDSGFLIFEDEDGGSLPSSSSGNGSDLFEQTVCTKEAMDEINKLFATPLDF